MSLLSKGGLRRLWLNVHLWIGVGLGIILIPLSLTGSALVWHDGLDRFINPARYAVSGPEASLPPSAYLTAGSEALGTDIQVSALRLPAEVGDPVVVAGRGKPAKQGDRPSLTSVYLDPPTAKVLAVADFRSSLVGFMHDFHGNLLVPGLGRQIVGWLGVAMLISCLTGIWLWWPRYGNLKSGFAWRRSPTTSANLHHMFGFWIAIPLAILSFTGLYISFPMTMRSVVSVFAEISSAQQRGGGGPFAAPITPKMTPDAAIAAAEGAAPGSKLLSINFPAGQNPSWRIQMNLADGETRQFTVNDNSGEVKSPQVRGGEAGDAMAPLMRSLHDGGDMGIVWQIIIFIGGLLPALLTVTGVMMWLRKRKNRAAV